MNDETTLKPNDDRESLYHDARTRYEVGTGYWSDWRRLCRLDRTFYAGEQWMENDRNRREIQKRPCLTINRLPVFARQIIGDARQNKPAIKIMPAEDGDVQIAEIYEGLIRNIENTSVAEDAYDTAFENALVGGFGAWRVCTDYVSDDTFDQHILIERIREPLGITIDPAAERADFSDALWLFYEFDMSKEEFKSKWPDADVSDFASNQYMAGWLQRDTVRVAEYWYKEEVTKTLYLLRDGTVTDQHVAPELVVKQRSVKSFRIRYAVMSGREIIDGPHDWAADLFPFAIVVGEEYVNNGRVDYRGIVRNAMDAQRMYNYWRTMETETIAMAPKSPMLVAAEQVEGLEDEWENLSTRPMPFVRYNANTNAPMPAPIQPPQIPTAYANASAVCVDEIKSTTGLFNASLGESGSETSGRAILARQREGDTATYLWMDNWMRAIRYTGRLLVQLIPKIYDTERIVRVLGIDGQHQNVAINKTVMGDDGQPVVVNDLSFGRYDVVVESGPSYATQRTEAANSMVAFIQAMPSAAPLVADLIAKNMDWPGAEEIAQRLRTMLPQQLQDNSGLPPEIQQMIDQGKELIAKQQQEIEKLRDEVEDKDEDRRLKQYEIDVRAALESAKLVAGQPDMGALAMQVASILAEHITATAAAAPDVTEINEEPEDAAEESGVESPGVHGMPQEFPEQNEQPEMMQGGDIDAAALQALANEQQPTEGGTL